jgi:hypothetical protein
MRLRDPEDSGGRRDADRRLSFRGTLERMLAASSTS